ncbi:LiaI-LiaF-like domain-containing protein [Mucilaginibacter litoreus]|uniref:LiaI-LiaF-like domain-containing protein n=1 Tax=Mucilaginibacter litoreus TaxID=1048221 RepID=A0ABW3AP10_9SPHI
MSNNINIPNKTPKTKVMFGAVLLIIGVYLLLRQFGILFIPDSIDLWPLWLIFWGVVVGARNNYQKSSGIILIGLGVIFMITENIHNADSFVWPIAIIALGFWIMSKKSHKTPAFDNNYWDKKYRTDFQAAPEAQSTDFNDATFNTSSTDVPPVQPAGSVPPPSQEDFLDATAIFGGVNKTILSKNFQGGDITNIFGGAELDFTQADINGRVVIDITQVFGGIKLIVPANWHVVPDLAAVFAGVDDRRIKTTKPINNDKVLVLKGVSLFAGVDIRSY